MYDKDWLNSTLASLHGDIQDLQDWSVHNKDKWLEEIAQLKEDVKKLEEAV